MIGNIVLKGENIMTKAEFISAVAEKAEISKKDAEKFAKVFVEELAEVMQNGDSVSFQGFGTFKAAEVAARECRNPATGATVKVAAHKKPVFTASSALKDAVK